MVTSGVETNYPDFTPEELELMQELATEDAGDEPDLFDPNGDEGYQYEYPW